MKKRWFKMRVDDVAGNINIWRAPPARAAASSLSARWEWRTSAARRTAARSAASTPGGSASPWLARACRGSHTDVADGSFGSRVNESAAPPFPFPSPLAIPASCAQAPASAATAAAADRGVRLVGQLAEQAAAGE